MALIEPVSASAEELHEIELENRLVLDNAKLAAENRASLDRHRVTAFEFLGAIGSGKTTLISRLINHLKNRLNLAALIGSATITQDSDPIARQGVPLVRIATINVGHLDAHLVGRALPKIDLNLLNLIFIENIGNLISPVQFPLGSRVRIVVVSVTEGAWVVKKHPHIFMQADLVIINKIDLAGAMEVRLDALANDVFLLKPSIHVIPISCKTGDGISEVAFRILAFHGPFDH